jgi:acyl carrier protein
MRTDVSQFVVEMIAAMNYDVEGVTEATPLGAAGIDLESLALAELAVRVEDEYQVKFAEDEMEAVAAMTLGELVEMITARAGLVTTGEA